ncbi:glycoside hydrolase family 55 protein [Microdochium trichocladiopsis]|uniref:Glycoside hydrolase family 55 protein n=1 Tax=Microdochium trichocladiopsis TaxID=1682393 RepID=A0A9P8YAB9_9PEZI|nr:glycoside hydrolase family 55 protein [Microdochium trichocladiopsis]KAH7034731.1 glycoside hydrolase family 55 protein [Microdochium trichocladiopsis]
MRASMLAAVFLPAVLAHNIKIPAVEKLVDEQLSLFADYVDLNGTAGHALSAGQGSVFFESADVHAKRQSSSTPYWYESIKKQGISAFNTSPSTYKVFRNVKDYGARGDGVTDDTAAINKAISDGNRCAPGSCSSSSTTNAVVYFPAGTYVVSSSIVSYYSTNLIGNPNNLPVLKATPNFVGFGVIDAAQYQPGGVLPYGATNIFWRQVRNFVIDLTGVPATVEATGIHWPTAQATSLQNIVFKMSSNTGTKHQGVFIEAGSGGMLNDLVFYGGLNAAVFGNQQFTVRNLTFYNAVTAINQIWDWGWTYKSISVNNCTVGLNMATTDPNAEVVGSVVFFDSSFTNTKIAFKVSRTPNSSPKTGGSLAIENIVLRNVDTAIQYGPSQTTLLAGGTRTITSWVSGSLYNPTGPQIRDGVPVYTPVRPAGLLQADGKYYERSKPQYNNLPLTSFLSVRAAGAKGDGKTDDTAAIQAVLNQGALNNQVVYFDAGTYIVTSTIFISKQSRIVGEAYPVIMSRGAFFNDMNNPQPVVNVGNPGGFGTVEWSDMIISTQGPQAGATLIQWNLASPAGAPSGMWDVHTRVGGTVGSGLTLAECAKTPESTAINRNCISAYMGMHVTKTASTLYMENVWLWVADHDVDDKDLRQITIFSGRGLLIESTSGNLWLVGTSVEHFARYQYNFVRTQNIFAGQIQTETPYYMPNPNAFNQPFPAVTALDDPGYGGLCPAGSPATCAEALGLRVNASKNIFIYGAGLYSFFNNYSTTCSERGNANPCQTAMVQYDDTTSNFFIYALNTIGASGMVYRQTTKIASNSDNVNVFPSSIIVFRSDVVTS